LPKKGYNFCIGCEVGSEQYYEIIHTKKAREKCFHALFYLLVDENLNFGFKACVAKFAARAFFVGKIIPMISLRIVNSIFDRRIAIVMIAGMFFFSGSVHAESSTHIARYLTVENHALPEQKNLLEQVFQVHFSRDIHTIGDAMRYLLRPSGYRLVDDHFLPKAAQALLLQPLPEVHRRLGPMPLQEGLLTLVGFPFRLAIDPVHRFINLRLKPDFQSMDSVE
jgi:conjugative transfer region protein (TIGR03748 family)